MIEITLRDAIEKYEFSSGERMTYQMLSERTGISVDTLQSIATRPTYNTTLSTVEKLCVALSCEPSDLLRLA
jgi:DNA-binding Xre family transcriptional regulator